MSGGSENGRRRRSSLGGRRRSSTKRDKTCHVDIAMRTASFYCLCIILCVISVVLIYSNNVCYLDIINC